MIDFPDVSYSFNLLSLSLVNIYRQVYYVPVHLRSELLKLAAPSHSIAGLAQ